MKVKTLYQTQPDAYGRPTANGNGCSLAIGRGSDGTYAFSTYGFDTDADGNPIGGAASFAIVDRAELRLVYEALGRELADG